MTISVFAPDTDTESGTESESLVEEKPTTAKGGADSGTTEGLPPTPALTAGNNQPPGIHDHDLKLEPGQAPIGRTLFIRSIPYKTPEIEVENLFKAFGPLFRFFPMIDTRGMAFVSFVSFHRRLTSRLIFCLV
jgi:hypothetical protein